jgi:hypothetical protein
MVNCVVDRLTTRRESRTVAPPGIPCDGFSGVPLYRAAGFEGGKEIIESSGGAGVPLLRMRKSL